GLSRSSHSNVCVWVAKAFPDHLIQMCVCGLQRPFQIFSFKCVCVGCKGLSRSSHSNVCVWVAKAFPDLLIQMCVCGLQRPFDIFSFSCLLVCVCVLCGGV